MTTRKPKRENGPALPERRSLLLGMGAAGGGAVLAGLSSSAVRADQSATTEMPAAKIGGMSDAQPFHGDHQAGITTARPAAVMAVAFDVLATTRADLQRLFQTLTERISFLMKGGTAPTGDPKFPPADSGVLGPQIVPDNLTMTVAVGASLFDDRFGLQNAKPSHLVRMTEFPNDALDADICHGDLLLQICSNSNEVNIHALRDVVKNLPDLLMVRWKQDGFLRIEESASKKTARNLLGFKDGTANPNAADEAVMNKVVWVQPDAGEPAWATGGTYQAVRVIRHMVERWDRTPLHQQAGIFGRDKVEGAPLGMKSEFDAPDYASDPKGQRIALDSHIRLANPRTPETEENLMLRRPFNYSRGVTKSGQLDMGLLFICFQSNLEKGFLTVQKRLNGEQLEEYIKPIGGGYFFVLPGVPTKDGYLGQSLIEST
ncbi:MAG: deferrochelatase/peroxidase EfeB [Rhodospirillaceae bacterium]|nr:MAG: deferrochelatase/peroxidase EfeB [Rhodospirillaceae bacterium]